jgi:hypothetical protein
MSARILRDVLASSSKAHVHIKLPQSDHTIGVDIAIPASWRAAGSGMAATDVARKTAVSARPGESMLALLSYFVFAARVSPGRVELRNA